MADESESEMSSVNRRVFELLKRSEDALKRVRKRHNAGVLHESHLAYADGLRDGLQSAMDVINTKEMRT